MSLQPLQDSDIEIRVAVRGQPVLVLSPWAMLRRQKLHGHGLTVREENNLALLQFGDSVMVIEQPVYPDDNEEDDAP